MRQELVELERIVYLLNNISTVFKQENNVDETIIKDVFETVEEVNKQLFGCSQLSRAPIQDQSEDIDKFNKDLDRWLHNTSNEIEYRKQISKRIDYEFYIFSVHIKEMSEEELIEESIDYLKAIRRKDEKRYKQICSLYSEYYFFWGALDLDNGEIDLIKNRVHEMKNHWQDFEWLYNNLADYRSKMVLYGILCYWLKFDMSEKNRVKETNYDDYYDFDIMSCSDDEVFVDLGTWIGDSTQSFIANFGSYKRIYCYEMTEASMEQAKKSLVVHDNIVYRQVAVGNVTGMTTMFNFNDSSSNIVSPQGEKQIPIVRIDEDIEEPITFLKMDIEGSELDAMMGAEQHIRNDKPKLAICTYHNNHHIYEIPKLMREYNPDYKLYMRYNGDLDDPRVCEYVTFGLPI